MDFFKALAIISPFISAAIAGVISYLVMISGKRYDFMYQSKIPAFKDLSLSLINYKNYCLGKVANYEGNEFSPYFELEGSTLQHRTVIAQVASLNTIYFSDSTRKLIDELMNSMSSLCNAELHIASGQEFEDLESSYYSMSEKVELCITALYKELNFGS